ncbi:DUF1697 domain-containing protein [Sulfobacillus sp. DSM 109850]|uniref:DUF1697 domain-containing protein n=1 Tax=Sulfobacillus harzensis TaxID=2729629 RepID=A0A7Y0Q1Y2_9FIRM|nr:DUF1697 domain-containing protein [Sulfobacillus harzensis]
MVQWRLADTAVKYLAKGSRWRTPAAAYLRAVNVNGKNMIRMANLRQALADSGLGNVGLGPRQKCDGGNRGLDRKWDFVSLRVPARRTQDQLRRVVETDRGHFVGQG